MEQGRIVKALSGFYDVDLGGGRIVTCKARGRLRKEGTTPLVGDQALVENAMVQEILPRRNWFVRPAVANLDLLVLLASEVIPVTEPFLVDRITAIAGSQGVEVVIVVNKTDLSGEGELARVYRRAGYRVVCTSAVTGQGIEELRAMIAGKVVALSGNSGVGKSSILNRLAPSLCLPTGEVSDKLGRGRHTTRHIQLFSLPDGTYVADTPGFSSFDTEQMEVILKENLQYAFPDFAPFLGRCQFHDCAHLREPGCAVTEALARGEIEPSRYESYRRLYEIARDRKAWEK
ncbi:MAG TPA: ribosome small subunit-dependent GTPase A [Candidatus Avoscillospira avicola]|uniref:Small ribosomal subunit biogenesis GTPase RsgA n=1 Tax=Candidatus Avoscillospira avicola TaxID=2840706 RepID=A0A9D1DHG7_9FIRM|nr:ribosome small subunit-dependent GTPase A [Candidatus Avoscillospira avicola]